jgi:hypothetical protein
MMLTCYDGFHDTEARINRAGLLTGDTEAAVDHITASRKA